MKELRYGPHESQVAHLYTSSDGEDESEHSPYLLVYVHGGLWVDGSPAMYAPLAKLLVRSLWTVAVLGYRRSVLDDVMAPTHSEDVALGVQSIFDFVKPNRYVLVGHSCGAHMAALVWSQGASPTLPSPTIVVGIEGMFDLHAFAEDFAEWRGELEQSQGSDDSKWLCIDSPKKSALDTLWIVLHAPNDKYVNLRQATDWIKRLASWGISHASRLQISGGHFSAVRDLEPEAKQEILVELNRAMQRCEELSEGLQDQRQLLSVGYREGIDVGKELLAQKSFSRGVESGAQWEEAARILGRVATARRLLSSSLSDASNQEALSLEKEIESMIAEDGSEHLDECTLLAWKATETKLFK